MAIFEPQQILWYVGWYLTNSVPIRGAIRSSLRAYKNSNMFEFDPAVIESDICKLIVWEFSNLSDNIAVESWLAGNI